MAGSYFDKLNIVAFKQKFKTSIQSVYTCLLFSKQFESCTKPFNYKCNLQIDRLKNTWVKQTKRIKKIKGAASACKAIHKKERRTSQTAKAAAKMNDVFVSQNFITVISLNFTGNRLNGGLTLATSVPVAMQCDPCFFFSL